MNHSIALSILLIRRVIFLCFLIIPLSANAAIYMFIDGVPGDSQDQDHRDWIDISSVEESMTQSFDPLSGGRTGRATLLDTVINKELDRTSPVLRQELTSGRPLQQVIISVTTSAAGGPRIEYFRLTYTDVLLTSISMQGTGGEATLAEDVSFTFSRVEWRYTPIDDRGIPGASITTGWDVLANSPL